MAKSKIKSKITSNKNEKFTLKTVKDLGGTEDDFTMLKDIDSDDIDELQSVKSDGSGTREDIKDFISKLGFQNIQKNINSSMLDADDEDSEDEKPTKSKTKEKRKSSKLEDKTKLKIKQSDKSSKVETKTKLENKLSVKPGKVEEKTKPKKTSSDKQTNMTIKTKQLTTVSKPESKTSHHVKDTSDTPVTKSNVKIHESSNKKSKNKFKVQHSEVSSSTTSPEESIRNHIGSYKTRKHVIIKPDDSIHNEKINPNLKSLPFDVIRDMENFAAKLLEDEVATYKRKKDVSKSSEAKWIQTVLKSGTLSDKMAALTLLIQESPIHNSASLESLVNMARKKGKRECILATESLSELFLTEVLPSNRKLHKFSKNPSLISVVEHMPGERDMADKKLILWFYESNLKDIYSSFIKALDTMSHDTVLAPKQKAVTSMFKLLAHKPEQESVLLPLLVNKLGDPDYKLASRASHHLTKLVEEHPRMTMIVLKEVERLLYRPNISNKAQYYTMCFLSQIVLYIDDKELAMKLIDLYFSFFTMYVKKGEVDNKMMSVLLTGVNRAYPYAKVDEQYISEQMNNLYKVVHIVNFNTGLQALMLLYQIMDASESISDRFYVALYKKLADPALKLSSKQTMFLNLLYKAMKNDVADKRVKAFLKRLLQVCSYQTAQFVCGALILVSEILHAKRGLLNLNCVGEDSDSDEHFEDLPEPEEFKTIRYHSDSEAAMSEGEIDFGDQPSSWLHRKNLNTKLTDKVTYDPYHRNPLYCRADTACIWELKKLTLHFHPSVVVFANNILKSIKIAYSGDPLQDFTLIRFLERFVYKNPKKISEEEDSESKKKSSSRFRLKPSLPTGVRKLRVNEAAYVNKEEKRIPADEKFFHRYFRQRAALGKKTKKDQDSDVEDVSDDEFEAFLDNFEKQADPKDVFMKKNLNLDFAGEFGKKKTLKKKKKDESSDDDDDDVDDDDLSDEEPMFDEDEMKAAFEEFNTGNEDFNEEDITFSDEDEEESIKPKKATKRKSKLDDDMLDAEYLDSSKKKKSKNVEDLYAAAEEFSSIMDSNIDDVDTETLGSQALSNRTNSDVKQLRWEIKRDKWIHDKDWKSKKRPQQKGGRRPKHQAGGKMKSGGMKKQGSQIKKRK